MAFKRRCAIFGLLFLLITQYGKLLYYDARHLTTYEDFPQYYMGGLIARVGAWDSLYPIPIPNSPINAGFAEGSIMRPQYRDLAFSHGLDEGAVRFIQPPPVALLLIPLSWLPVHTSFYLWT